MKRLRKWLTIGAISVTALLAIVAQLSFTHPWDEWWINQATEISILEEEQETKLKGKQVEEFLSGYSFNYEKTMDFRCTRFVKKGKIRIGNKDYEIELIEDKFTGFSLLVKARLKTLEIFER